MEISIPSSKPEELAGTLFVMGTPIGNLEDVSLRVLRLVQDVSVLLCEDTRVTSRLLSRYAIPAGGRLRAFHQHVDDAQITRCVEELQAGGSAALVTDAGTPCLSDPGWTLVNAVREAGLRVEVVPGPSALTAALSVAGVDAPRFVFLGFPPVKKGRQSFFKEAAALPLPFVLYESPYRIRKTLEVLVDVLPERRVVLARELSKVFEEVRRGTAAELLLGIPDAPKGEFVVIVEAHQE